jgi:hypothetical protein
MFIYFVIKVVISLALIGIVISKRKNVTLFEILALYLLSSSVLVILQNIVSLNMELLTYKKTLLPGLIQHLDHIIIIPCLTLLLFYNYKNSKIKIVISYFLTLIWASIYIGNVLLNKEMEVVKFKGWNVLIGYIEAFVLLICLFIIYLISGSIKRGN